MADEEDYSSLPLSERLVHKVWKVRQASYLEIIKSFEQSPNENAECFQPFLHDPNIFKSIVVEKNVVAQDTGILALVKFLEFGGTNACIKLRSTIMPSLIEKALSSSRPSTKKNSIEAILWFIELDIPDPIIEDLLLFIPHKLPKLVVGTLQALVEIFKSFGAKVISPKPIIPLLPKLFAHGDRNVRAQTSNLSLEIYRGMGEPFSQILFPDLKPVQVKDLTKLFDSIKNDPPCLPPRMLKSAREALEREKAILNTSNALAGNTDNDYDMSSPANDQLQELDAYDMITAVDLLPNLPEDLSTRINSSKWKERKEVLEEIQPMFAKTMKLAKNVDYSDFIRILSKCMKDANIMVVTFAANITSSIAKALRKDFQKYLELIFINILERTKEKKPSIADALNEALFSCFNSSSLSDILPDSLKTITHKTPQIRISCTKFLIKCLQNTKIPPTDDEVKSIMEVGLKILNDTQAPVRNEAQELIGTLMKITGERQLNQYFENIDQIKTKKIKECFEKAEVKAVPVVIKPKTRSKPNPPSFNGPRKPTLGKMSRPPASKPPPINTFSPSQMLKKNFSSILPSKRMASSPLKRNDDTTAFKSTNTNGAFLLQETGKLTSISLTNNNIRSKLESVSNENNYDTNFELKQLKREKEALLKEKNNFELQQSTWNIEKNRMLEELEMLRLQNESLKVENLNLVSKSKTLKEEFTNNKLSLKSKDTQLTRVQLDLENSRNKIIELQKELEKVRSQSHYYPLTSTQLKPNNFPNAKRASMFEGLSTSSMQMISNQSNDIRSGVENLSIENGLSYMNDDKSMYNSNFNQRNSGQFSPRRSMIGMPPPNRHSKTMANVFDPNNDDSWRRAAEVTSQLKARIEKMKARSRNNIG
ncbi:Stu2p [Ascoidea rubescens DSM 1968]|uniref:ARM repeat-containing protein n=1 Tax=Ascoidea rubescens DSM 1968 TaxID=1344418 RepID=A0A1D2VQX5_9ASCO|nr:ARM repeat-containing protein [Ascoidea rubescens DSM 1968]ODV64011.1 ARM repeat-containing protein [Ascoidea rubescens DSM 1968]